MEFIFILTAILFVSVCIFMLIEYPYYLVGVFIFLHMYMVNVELPGPLDLRGIISIGLLFRLVIFDKENFDLLKQLLSNRFVILLLLFVVYSTIDYLMYGSSILITFRLLILNIVAFLLGFLTVYRGYQKTIIYTILITAIFSFGDIIYSYLVKGSLYFVKIIDLLIGGNLVYNHDFFGSMCAQGLVVVIVLYMTRQITKKNYYKLMVTFSLGILISTSRGAILGLVVAFIFIFFIQDEFKINFKKLFGIGSLIIVIFTIILFSYSFILSSLNVSSEFSDEIYYKLVGEPLSLFSDDYNKYNSRGKEKEGTMSWRAGKYTNDIKVFFRQKTKNVLFGFGEEGYFKIGEITWGKDGSLYQYPSHNFYTNLIAEFGIVGMFLFFLFFLSLFYYAIKLIRQGKLHFSLMYMLFYLVIYSVSHDGDFTEKFGFALYGCIIAEFIIAEHNKEPEASELIPNNFGKKSKLKHLGIEI